MGNLDAGFLISYDWIPAFETLSGDDYKTLLSALIKRQWRGEPLPTFENEMMNVFARMIEPTIKRRLDGQKGGNAPKGDATVDTVVDTMVDDMVASKVEISKEKISLEKQSGAEMHQESLSTAPPLSEADRNQLLSEGVPNKYIEEARVKRAEEYARKHRKRTVEVLRAWWEQERKKTQARGEGDLGNSYNTDDFFAAAVKRSQHENYEEVKT